MFSYFQAPVIRAQGSCISLVNIFGFISWRRLWGSTIVKPLSPPGHKSCMVLTRSMANSNDVQGDEPPRPTALERQVQTLAAAVERLTKQNHDLEE